MATKIVTKNSSTASAVPTASDLVQGELAVNVADKRLFTEDNAGAIVELGTNPSGNVTFQDNGKAIFGAGSDLQIYHDGSNSRIVDAGTGIMTIQASSQLGIYNADGTQVSAEFVNDGKVGLRFSGSEKLVTTSTGIDVTGTATMDGLTVDGDSTLDALELTASSSFPATGFSLNANGFLYGMAGSQGFILRSASNSKALLNIASNGDISFYEDTGTTPKMVWSSSAESLSVPTLSITDGSITTTAATGDHTVFNSTGADADFRVRTGANTHSLYVEGNTGNVGIGCTPTRALDVSKAGSTILANFKNTGGTTSFITLGNTTSTADQIRIGTDNTAFTVSTNYAERMRLNASGDWMVSNTAANVASGYDNQAGCGWKDSDTHFEIATTSNRSALEVGKNNANDGDLVTFRKQSTPVGSIGTVSGYLYLGGTAGNDAFLSFGADGVRPATSAGAARDAAIDLGGSTNRFKDLYLSGGVVFGATGGSVSSKTLDDYEEGTFTASLRGGTSEPATLITADIAKYTKIGDMVHIEISLENETTTGYAGALTVTGLPFTSGGGRTMLSVGHYQDTTWADGLIPISLIASGSTQVDFLNIQSGSAWSVSQHNSAGGGRYLWVSGAYKI